MSKISPKINEKGLIALETVLGNFHDRVYTEKGFSKVFNNFSEDVKTDILLRLFNTRTETKQLDFLEKVNKTKTEWDWIKYKFDNYWLALVEKGVNIKDWIYTSKSTAELQKEGFYTDISDISEGKHVDLKIKHKKGYIMCLRFNYIAGEKEYIDHAELHDLRGFGTGCMDEHSGPNGQSWVTFEDESRNLMLMSSTKFDEFISEYV